MSPCKCGGKGGSCGVSAIHRSPNKLCRSNSIFNLMAKCVKTTCPRMSSPPTSGRERPLPRCRQSRGGHIGGWAPASARHRPDPRGHSPHSSIPRECIIGLTEEDGHRPLGDVVLILKVILLIVVLLVV
jgi:hypothetical protein